MARYDYLIVGSGLYGATFAHKATQQGKKCLVIDKRPQYGGNIYCENIEGINVHKYGAHIFHTDNKKVWDFVNGFVEFNRYTNSPLARYNEEQFNLPFNMNTFRQMWGVNTPEEAFSKLEEQRQEAKRQMLEEGAESPRNLEEQALLLIGRDIYEKLIKGYTEKQWGRPCHELPAFIIKRLPVRMVYDNNYFNDRYQGIPIGGYNLLIDGLLKGCDAVANADFFKDIVRRSDGRWAVNTDTESLANHKDDIFENLLFTGRIDEFYDFRYGRLDYRTVRFETETLATPNYQGNAVVNYTDSKKPYTRIIEHKHFEMFGQQVYDCKKTVISREYSTEWEEGMEPFYPVNDARNAELYAKYKLLADQEQNVLFGGRLAEYKYYDMAPIVERVLELFEISQKS